MRSSRSSSSRSTSVRKWYLASSPWPERSSRGGSVARASRSQSTALGCQYAPTRFLPSGRFTPVLPPTAASTMAEQRGGHVHDGDAAVVAGGGEAGDVGDQPAADGDHGVGAGEAPAGPLPAEVLDRGEGLGVLAVRDRGHAVLAPGVDGEPDAGLGDHGHPARGGGQQARQLVAHPRPDEHRVATARRGDLDDVHDASSCSRARTSSATRSAKACRGSSPSSWKGSTETVRSATSA